jgi:acyl-CoA hydrolase
VQRLPSVDELDMTRFVRAGDVVTWTQGAAEPLELVERLLAQRHRIGPFTILLPAGYARTVRPGHGDICTFVGFGGVGSNRALAAAGQLDIVPAHLSHVPRLLADGDLHIDVVLTQASEDPHSGFSFGAVNSYVGDAFRRARTVIAEVNANAPWTYSVEPYPTGHVDVAVPSHRPLVTVRARAIDDTTEAIAKHIAALVPDGSVLQLGIGAVPDALARHLAGHSRLGLHSGVIGDAVVGLVTSGVMDHSRKTIDTGVGVTGGLAGSADLYTFADHNPLLRVDPVRYTHAPATLGRLDGLVAVNSGLEVDLTGQVGSEVAGGAYVGTVGGQVDFVRGALASRGGRSIIGLPSRTARGALPRIVPFLASGVVTVPRSDADVVVTEHGVARLRGASLRQRVEAMIAIAHPDDREELARRAHQLKRGR